VLHFQLPEMVMLKIKTRDVATNLAGTNNKAHTGTDK
jgi:hypothetical protein